MTLDKFTHRIIRTFARDLNISLDFDVELDTRKLQNDATELLVEQIGKDPVLTRLMLNYAKTNLEEDKSWDFTRSLAEFAGQIFKEDAIPAINKLKELSSDDFIKIGTNLRKEITVFENSVRSNALQVLDILEERGIEAEDLGGKSRSVYPYFKKLLVKIEKPSNTLINNASIEKLPHKNSLNRVVVEEIAPTISKYFDQIQTIIEVNWSDYVLNKQLVNEINNMSLLGHVMRILDEIKEEQNILLISDFYRKIAEVVQNEPVPYIYERLGIRYQHFLLDEFQDTSHLQWVNVVPLIHNSISQEQQNLIVGDGKQAIYRWRNGEVAQFVNLPEEVYNPYEIASLTEAQPQFKAAGIKKKLDFNYRSAPEIVNFNNALFKSLSNKLGGAVKTIYEGLEQTPKQSHQGYVELMFDKKLEEEDQLRFVLESVQTSIERGFEQRDICILVRRGKEGNLLTAFLNENGYNVVSPDSLAVGRSNEIQLVLYLLKILQRPKDVNLKKRFLEFYAKSINDESPLKFTERFSENLSETSPGQLCRELGFELPMPSDFLNLYELVAAILATLKFEISESPFLNHLMNQVFNYEKKRGNNIREFIVWFDDFGSRESVSIPQSQNALQLMTIHKAKGLEFKIVIAPFLNFDWTKKDIVWMDQKRANLPAFFFNMTKAIEETELNEEYSAEMVKIYLDYLNLIYVAFTRPELALFVCGKEKGVAKEWIMPFLKNDLSDKLINDRYIVGAFLENEEQLLISENLLKITPMHERLAKPEMSFQPYPDLDFEDAEFKRSFGTELHLVLSKLNNLKELELITESLIKKGNISVSNKIEINSTIKKLFENETFESYFIADEIWNEKVILDTDGKRLIPDRIVRHGDSMKVVDFKSGHPMKSHFSQVRKYISLLQEMGFKNVTGELFYTQTSSVKEL